MAVITNTPSKTDDNRINDLRNAFEHRAVWFALLIDEARKKGLDVDFARKAILRCGGFHAHTKYPRTDSIREFTEAFANDNVVNIFEMDVKTANDEKMEIEFHYCPLVEAWKKLGFSDDDIATFCDIAMDGDRGIIDEYDNFEFHLGKTIAKGDAICEVMVTKNK